MAKQVTTPKPDEFARSIKFSKNELEGLALLKGDEVSKALGKI